jgi:hypothetical protein
MWLRLRSALICGLLAAQAQAFAQCSMCRTALESNPQLGGAIDKAIIVLLVPAVALFCGVYFLAFRYDDSKGTDEGD